MIIMRYYYLTLCLVLGLFSGLSAQNYTISSSIGTEDDFDYNTAGATTVLAIPATEVLSTWQTIPFSFSFYGSAVTGYYASDNGYITFDNTATVSFNTNTAIPVAGGPNKAIYAFWDDVNVISGTGSVDKVNSWTYGTAPNRVHVIQWYSVTPLSGTGFIYCAIRLYECGDFDVINHFGNAAGMTGTIGCENATGTVGVQVSGTPNLTYPAVGSLQNDDVVYTFINSGISYDVQMKTLDLQGNVTLGNNTVSGTLRNLGAATITSLDLNYTVNGGGAVVDNITGLNIAPGAVYNYSHGTPWNVATGGQTYNLCVYASNINGNADQRACNDQICESLFSNNGVSGSKKVLIEEFTGAWCGWCPDGEVVVDDILSTYPNDVYSVSVHDNDAMDFADGIRTGFNVTAYPNGMVDRFVFDGEPKEPHSRGVWLANTATRLGEYTPVNVGLTNNVWNAGTRQISLTAQASFVDYAAGDLRFIVYIVEDNVTGVGTGYNQVNYLNTTAGHPYFGAGDPIIGYNHRRVLRALPGGTYGNAGVIPATVSPGSSYTESFTYTLPASYDETNLSIVVAVGLYSPTVGQRYIYNVYGEDLQLVVGREEEKPHDFLQVYPNPNTGSAMLKLQLSQSSEGELAVYDTFGKKVKDFAKMNFKAGENRIPIELSSLSNGIYFVKVITDNGTITEKIIVAK